MHVRGSIMDHKQSSPLKRPLEEYDTKDSLDPDNKRQRIFENTFMNISSYEYKTPRELKKQVEDPPVYIA